MVFIGYRHDLLFCLFPGLSTLAAALDADGFAFAVVAWSAVAGFAMAFGAAANRARLSLRRPCCFDQLGNSSCLVAILSELLAHGRLIQSLLPQS